MFKAIFGFALLFIATAAVASDGVVTLFPGEHPYPGTKYQFRLDNAVIGQPKSVEGGAIMADVIVEKQGADGYVRKHLGPVKYEDITLKVGLGMTDTIYDWIGASWNRNYQRKDGAIVACDYNQNAKSEREFLHALVTETTIPALDGASKDVGYLTVKVSPELIRVKAATGKCQAGAPEKQKNFIVNNFRLELDGIDTNGVRKIDSFSIKQAIVTNNNGRDTRSEPGKLEFPNLKVNINERSAASWQAWFDDFVVRGNNTTEREKNGAIVLLTPDLKTELARINLRGVGIFSFASDLDGSSSDKVETFTAELYVERMEFQAK